MKWQLVGGKRDGPLAMLDMREAFLFRTRQDAPIFYEAGGRVMICGIDSQSKHAQSRPDRVELGKRQTVAEHSIAQVLMSVFRGRC